MRKHAQNIRRARCDALCESTHKTYVAHYALENSFYVHTVSHEKMLDEATCTGIVPNTYGIVEEGTRTLSESTYIQYVST